MIYPSSEHARWWLKRGHAGRIAVVNYKPFPGEQIGKHGFKYHTDAFEEMERLERRRERRYWALQFLGGSALLLALVAQF